MSDLLRRVRTLEGAASKTEPGLLATLLRLANREGSLSVAIKVGQREHRTLPMAFVRQAERVAKAVTEAADAMERSTTGE